LAYKIRKYSSLEEALSYVIEQLGDDAIEKATDMSSSYIRKCSDADTNQRLPFHVALKIDAECIRQDKGTPLMNYYENVLEKEISEHKVEDPLTGILGQLSHNSNRIVERCIKAIDVKSPGGEKITKTELKDISEAIKKIEEKILKLKIKVQEHTN
tara:strand:+ start:781 stop:1248 length:468 start_codon:yes stop_codon:yes gene_type:complete